MGDFKKLAADMLDTCLKALGAPVVYTRGSEQFNIQGIFDKNYIAVDPNTGAAVISATPMLSVNIASLPGKKWLEGDTVTVDGVIYSVIEDQSDSGDGIKLILQRESPR